MPFSQISIQETKESHEQTPNESQKPEPEKACSHIKKLEQHRSRHSKSSLGPIKMQSPTEIMKRFALQKTINLGQSTEQLPEMRKTKTMMQRRTNSNMSFTFTQSYLQETKCFDLHKRFRIRTNKPTSDLHKVIRERSL